MDTNSAMVAWEYPIIFGLKGGIPSDWKPDENGKCPVLVVHEETK